MKFRSSGYLIKEGVKSIWNNRMMSLASIGVLISCLLITGAAVVTSLNASSLISSIGDDNMITVYLDPEISDVDALKLGAKFDMIDNVKSSEFYSKSKAIEDYEEMLGDDIYANMQGSNNPLPHAYKVSLEDFSKYESTVKEIEEIDGVYQISNRSDIARKLTKLNKLVAYIGIAAVAVLGLVTLFIISNTVKMTMYSRRFEISIMKSVGATNSFVRIPFLVEGMVIGLISGIISSVVMIALYDPILQTVKNIAFVVYQASIPISEIWIYIVLAFLGSAVLIGALGSFISVSKYLKKEGGEILGW